jgi:hypothetical protein
VKRGRGLLLAAALTCVSVANVALLKAFLDASGEVRKMATIQASHRCSPSSPVKDWHAPAFQVHDYLKPSVDPALVDRKPDGGEWPIGAVSGRG